MTGSLLNRKAGFTNSDLLNFCLLWKSRTSLNIPKHMHGTSLRETNQLLETLRYLGFTFACFVVKYACSTRVVIKRRLKYTPRHLQILNKIFSTVFPCHKIFYVENSLSKFRSTGEDRITVLFVSSPLLGNSYMMLLPETHQRNGRR